MKYNITFLYGIENYYMDITKEILMFIYKVSDNFKNEYVKIPIKDHDRAVLFGDPAIGKDKHILIKNGLFDFKIEEGVEIHFNIAMLDFSLINKEIEENKIKIETIKTKSKINICWVPRYHENGASSRIRVYSIHKQINKNFPSFTSKIRDTSEADVLVVQKDISPNVISKIIYFKGFTVFDFDDPIRDKDLKNMANLVDIITTDTKCRKAKFDKLNTGKECIVIDDCLDYGIEEPYPPPIQTKNVCWFGNTQYLSTGQWMVPIINDSGYIFNDIKWELNTFFENLRKNSLCVLSHHGSECKSNNKMLVSIACGIPCIVSESDSYKDLT